MHRLASLGVLLAVVGCDEEPLQIDRFPIGIHLDGGVPTLLAQVGDGGLTPVVIDTGSPLTLIANPSISRENAALTLYGFTAADRKSVV